MKHWQKPYPGYRTLDMFEEGTIVSGFEKGTAGGEWMMKDGVAHFYNNFRWNPVHFPKYKPQMIMVTDVISVPSIPYAKVNAQLETRKPVPYTEGVVSCRPIEDMDDVLADALVEAAEESVRIIRNRVKPTRMLGASVNFSVGVRG